MTEEKKSMTLVEGAFTPEQLLRMLQKTPASHIYKRPAKGGGQWDYVTGVYVKKVLNKVFGWMWSSEIRRIEEKHDQVIATIRLTIHDHEGNVILWKEDIGKKDIAKRKDGGYLDYGNDEKSAVTDGLKRCAAQFGIAGDIYGKDEFKEIKAEEVAIRTIPPNAHDDDPPTAAQLQAIKAMGRTDSPKTQREAKEVLQEGV